MRLNSRSIVVALSIRLVACASESSSRSPVMDAAADAGPAASVDAGDDDLCTGLSDAELCAALHYLCGAASAPQCLTPRSMDCGVCAAGTRCDGDHRCAACAAEDAAVACARHHANCGALEFVDDCGIARGVECGDCAAPETCGGGGLDGVCGAPDAPICDSEGWCWQAPLVPGMEDATIWATSSEDLWALGDSGAFHWNGTGWVRYAFPPVFGVGPTWGRSSHDIWAEEYVTVPGDFVQRLAHWDGAAWTEHALPDDHLWINGFWGASANDVWAAGSSGALRFDGRGWRRAPEACAGKDCALTAVDGTAADDVWVAGSLSEDSGPKPWVAHWNGHTWAPQPAPSRSISSLQAVAADDVWASASDGLFHWNGAKWARVEAADPYLPAQVFAPAPDDVWLAGLDLRHLAGEVWEQVSLPGARHPARMMGQRGSYVVAADASVFVGGLEQGWEEIGRSVGPGDVLGVWGAQPNDLWAVGEDGLLLRSDGRHWTAQPCPTTASLAAVWGSAADDVWFVGPPNASSAAPPPTGATTSIIVHWDGRALTATPLAFAARLAAVWGTGANDVWAVGTEGSDPYADKPLVLHWNGATWTKTDTGATNVSFRGISGSGPNDVWAVGSAGNCSVTYHWDGTRWTQVASPTAAVFERVLSVSPNDVWASGMLPVGHTGQEGIWHWDGTAWSEAGRFFLLALNALCASGPNDIYAAGLSTVHWDGQAWTTVRQVNWPLAYGCATFAGAGTWLVGAQGTLVHHGPTP